MATEQVMNEMPRFSLLPLLLGMLEPSDGDQDTSERFVLINPFTQSMVVLHSGGSGGEGGSVLAAMLGGSMAGSAGPTGPPPASKASIEALRVVNREEEHNEEAECAVCLEKLFDEEKEEASAAVVVKEMPCAHRYHGECVEKWLRMHGSCPMCRYKMPREESEVKKSEEGGGNGNGVWVRISFGRREEGAAGDQRSSSTEELD